MAHKKLTPAGAHLSPQALTLKEELIEFAKSLGITVYGPGEHFNLPVELPVIVSHKYGDGEWAELTYTQAGMIDLEKVTLIIVP